MRRPPPSLALALCATLSLSCAGPGVGAALAQSVAAGTRVWAGAAGSPGAAGVSRLSPQSAGLFSSPSMSLGLAAPGAAVLPSAPRRAASFGTAGASFARQEAGPGAAGTARVENGLGAAPAAGDAAGTARAENGLRAAPFARGESLRSGDGGPMAAAPEGRPVLKALGREMPDLGRLGTSGAKSGAETDFMARAGAPYGEGGAVLAARGALSEAWNSLTGMAARLSRSAKGRAREMPADPPSPRTGPDGTDDLDELGNPRRRQDDGPDSVSDGSEGRGGGDEGLFGGLGEEEDKSEGPLPPPEQADMPSSVDLIVVLRGALRPLANDVHLSLAGRSKSARAVLKAYEAAQQGMLWDLEAAGLGQEVLDAFGASPVATYRRINAATLRVSASRAAQFRAALEAKGYQVYDNERRRIVEPVRPDEGRPDAPRPEARGAVTLPETLRLSTADKVHEIARSRWGLPGSELGFFGRLTLTLLRGLGLLAVPQPAVGVIDTGADTSHKLLRGVKEVKNVTRGENVDDNGHGTWVTSLVLYFAPWLKNVTHYKTFEGGGATLDDILKALTLSGNDGNIIISNSWGSDAGDPDGPDSQLVKKLAEEGRIMVFAAGNAGSRKNTIGSPAIVAHRDPATGASRVLAVAATDREGRTAYFSSRGKGSRVTSRDPRYKDWPQRPDLAEEGYNTEGAWPANLGPGRVDPELGPLNAISGTSMSTPKVAGTLALLAQLFGLTPVGEKLDAVVNALMKTLVNPLGQGKDDVGEGFNAVYAAYEELAKTMRPAAPPFIARWVLRLLVR